MEQQVEQLRNQSVQSTFEANKPKRPYQKISQETRSQILQALTVEKLSLCNVAEMFKTKACTCKAILQTYEQEGRREKKTSRRERVEIQSLLKIIVVDPLGRSNQEYINIKHSKMYTEEKVLSRKEEKQLKRRLQQEILAQLEELQTGCYNVQQTISKDNNPDEKAPENIARGVNMSLQLIQSKLKMDGVSLSKQETKKLKELKKHQQLTKLEELVKVEEGKSNQNSYIQQEQKFEIPKTNGLQELGQNYSKIKQFIESVNSKSQVNPQIIDKLNYLTNETIFQMSLKQRLQDKDFQVSILKHNVSRYLKQFFLSN
ncbi:unnamed protein product (macronuclear) [Paramecium tetraurelia]|uniref:HTH psq-type domain-containing protein n=1 Tax=Paramecium tetraurelia TaxID=5888 RepID=A0BYY7_PARTE|nr:uncharacterized protein GSPATT00033607001 [Paramecium tetraurelia]CAK63754.1 unnamed protein product [Paramecium tetraurelia]|eukprot:XP_001431152.1 hypothetical protein (macronuclear) [Paramecium tetraurelia strain d4-2]